LVAWGGGVLEWQLESLGEEFRLLVVVLVVVGLVAENFECWDVQDLRFGLL